MGTCLYTSSLRKDRPMSGYKKNSNIDTDADTVTVGLMNH